MGIPEEYVEPIRRVGRRAVTALVVLLCFRLVAPWVTSGAVARTTGYWLGTLRLPPLTTRVVASPTGYWLGTSRLPRPSLARGLLEELVLVVGCVREALSAAESERERVRAERDALDAFADGVESMAVAAPEADAAGLDFATRDDDRLQAVRARYEDTVMSVPHYEQQYGEDLAEHMAIELGDDLATAVVGGNEFSDRLRQLLVGRARAAARQRENLLDRIDDERASVTDARARLRATAPDGDAATAADLHREPFRDLIERERDLERRERQCEGLVEDRQEDIHRTNRRFTFDRATFQEYLYADLPVTFPVLSATLERLRRLRDRRRSVIRAISRRD